MDKENKNGSATQDDSKCEHCGKGGWMCGASYSHGFHKHGITRLVIKVIVILIIFWFGVKFGEMHGRGFGYGSRGYRNFPNRNMMYQENFGPTGNGYYGPGMMYRNPTYSYPGVSTSTTK
jgi:hypothetical protein